MLYDCRLSALVASLVRIKAGAGLEHKALVSKLPSVLAESAASVSGRTHDRQTGWAGCAGEKH